MIWRRKKVTKRTFVDGTYIFFAFMERKKWTPMNTIDASHVKNTLMCLRGQER